MEFDATKEINKRYELFKERNDLSSVDVPDFAHVPVFGENIDSYMEYIRNHSIMNAEPTNKVGKIMRKINAFWFRPIITNQDFVNDRIRIVLDDFYQANEIKRTLNERVTELTKRIEVLEKITENETQSENGGSSL